MADRRIRRRRAAVPAARAGEQPTEDSAGGQSVPGSPAGVPSVGTWVGPREEPARDECLEQVGGGAEGTVFRGQFVGSHGGTPVAVALKVYRRPPNAHPDWPDDGTWLNITDQAALLQGIAPGASLVRIREAFLGELTSAGVPVLNGAGRLVPHARAGHGVARRRSLTGELRDRRPPIAKRVTWIRQLAQAIELIHSVSRTHGNPLVHTDIKPGNCMITPGRGLVLVDTGAVHRAIASRNRRGLRTPPYAAPEVLADPGGQPLLAGDLYSLGAVAYHVLTGQAPPDSADPGYLNEARAQLNAVANLGPGHDRRTRRLVTEHVLVLPDPDPARRARVAPTAWADQLGRLIIRRRRRRAGVATARSPLCWRC